MIFLIFKFSLSELFIIIEIEYIDFFKFFNVKELLFFKKRNN